jgi:hypothetical protein
MVLGSVAHHVVAHAPCSVLVVRDSATTENAASSTVHDTTDRELP